MWQNSDSEKMKSDNETYSSQDQKAGRGVWDRHTIYNLESEITIFFKEINTDTPVSKYSAVILWDGKHWVTSSHSTPHRVSTSPVKINIQDDFTLSVSFPRASLIMTNWALPKNRRHVNPAQSHGPTRHQCNFSKSKEKCTINYPVKYETKRCETKSTLINSWRIHAWLKVQVNRYSIYVSPLGG